MPSSYNLRVALFTVAFVGIDVKLNCDYLSDKSYYNSLSKKVVYTGCIDEFFDYEFGKLQYRSLKFDTEILDVENYQGLSQINYTCHTKNWTRIVEHKHFEGAKSNKTVITKEYSMEHQMGTIPYYPINDEQNQKLYQQYKDKSKTLTNFIFGGRLSEYKYIDMDATIKSAMNKFGDMQ